MDIRKHIPTVFRIGATIRRVVQWLVRSAWGPVVGAPLTGPVVSVILLTTAIRLTAPTADGEEALVDALASDCPRVSSHLMERATCENGRIVFGGLDSHDHSIRTLKGTEVTLTNSGSETITLDRYTGSILILLRKVEGTRIWREADHYFCFLCTPRSPVKLEAGKSLTELAPLDFSFTAGWITRFSPVPPESDRQLSGIYRLVLLYMVGDRGDDIFSHALVNAENGAYLAAYSRPFLIRDQLFEWKDAALDALGIMVENALVVAVDLFILSGIFLLFVLARTVRPHFRKMILREPFGPVDLLALRLAGAILFMGCGFVVVRFW